MGRILLDSGKAHDFDIPETVDNWTVNPAYRLDSADFTLRPNRVVTSIVLHNTQGYWPQQINPGAAPAGKRAETVVDIWRRDKRSASAPLVIDTDGSTVQAHYLVPVLAWHAMDASPRSIGMELVQVTPGNQLWIAQMDTAAHIIHGLIQSRHPQIRLMPEVPPDEIPILEIRTEYPTDGKRPLRVPVEARGVFGHRDVRPQDRGRGDPGDRVMTRVAEVLESLCGTGPVLYGVMRT